MLFDLAAEPAERSLKAFSQQSGRGVIFVSEMVRGVRTNGVKGNFTPTGALDAMLHGTGLLAAYDAGTGAFAVRRQGADEPKNESRAAQ